MRRERVWRRSCVTRCRGLGVQCGEVRHFLEKRLFECEKTWGVRLGSGEVCGWGDGEEAVYRRRSERDVEKVMFCGGVRG